MQTINRGGLEARGPARQRWVRSTYLDSPQREEEST